MRVRISKEQAEAIASRLPVGSKVEDIRFLRCAAHLELPTEAELRLAEEVGANSGPPYTVDGQPNVMRVVAWFYHEGTNKNRFHFLADDMGASADQVRAPNLIPMDWNHGAVFQWREDPRAVGVWYQAEKRWDPNARNGAGAYGVQGLGTMWAWAFPEKANELLAMQARNGSVDFSVAVLPQSIEIRTDEFGTYEVLRNPIILAHSALDVPPADEDAIGLLVEGSTDPDTEARLRAELEAKASADAEALAAAQHTEERHMEELKQELEALRAQVATLTAAQDQVTALEARIAELEGQLAESETAREALVAEAAGVRAEAEAAVAELETLRAAEAARAAAEAEAAVETRWVARQEAMPEAYRTALKRRSAEEQERFAAKWRVASEEEWAEFQADVLTAFESIRPNYVRMSQGEGGALPTSAGGDSSMRSLLRRSE